MRVLYLTDNASIHNRRFLEKLAASGHEVLHWNLTAENAFNSSLPDGVTSVLSSSRLEPNAPLSCYRDFLPKFRSSLNELRPDLIHAGPVQTAGYLAALAEFHPVLIMSWGSDLLVDSERNGEWTAATRIALQNADAFFCDCDTVLKKANSFREFSQSQVVKFPWGVKAGDFSPSGPTPSDRRLIKERGTTTFIYTRSWSPLYGTEVLLDAFVRAYSANRYLRLLLVGKGSDDPSIQEYVAAHQFEHCVFAFGPQPTESLPGWFRAADAYISCAKSDGTSISLLEAMSTGLPVIVTDIPSNREWVNEPENGYLSESGSSESVADKMLQVASISSNDRESISQRNQLIVKNRADWDRNFPLLLSMYERLVALGS